MLKRDFVKKIGEIVREQGFSGTIAESNAYLNAVKNAVIDALQEGEDITIGGFLKIWSEEVPEHNARNPKTGETVTVPAHGKVKVKVLSELKESVR